MSPTRNERRIVPRKTSDGESNAKASDGQTARKSGWSEIALPFLSAAILIPLTQEHSAQSGVVKWGHFLSNLGYNSYIAVSLLVLFLWARGQTERRALWWPFDVGLCCFLCVTLLKFVSQLPRPSGSPSGFPSGHTTFSFALAGLILAARPRLAPMWFLFAMGVGWSRVEVGAHYPYQVVVGAFLGWGLSCAVSSSKNGVLLPRLLGKRRRSAAS